MSVQTEIRDLQAAVRRLQQEQRPVGVAEVQIGSEAVGAHAFPIGSVFFSAVTTNPNTLLGHGTWSSLGSGVLTLD